MNLCGCDIICTNILHGCFVDGTRWPSSVIPISLIQWIKTERFNDVTLFYTQNWLFHNILLFSDEDESDEEQDEQEDDDNEDEQEEASSEEAETTLDTSKEEAKVNIITTRLKKNKVIF